MTGCGQAVTSDDQRRAARRAKAEHASIDALARQPRTLTLNLEKDPIMRSAMIDPGLAHRSASSPAPLTAALVILLALAYPAPLITWWTALGPEAPAVSAALTAYYLAQVMILGIFLAGWCLPRSAIWLRVGIVAVSAVITVLAVTVPSLVTYGLYYMASAGMCLILAVQAFGRAPLWPPRGRDLPLTLVPLPIILASGGGVVALAAWLGITVKPGTALSEAGGLVGTIARIDTYPELLIRSLWTGIGEETAAALLVTGLARRHVPIVWVYLIPAIVRASYHAQFSWSAVALVILGVGMVYLWRRYERLLPLIAAHTLWDALGRHYPGTLLVLTGAGLLIIIGFCAQSGARQLWRRAERRTTGRPDRPSVERSGQVTP
ncbi:CPBP family intramembrane glutamic endopeptidase [Nonomuraea sp. NPDC059023]|uniref:CPBP family intramembrane glutamic endopeptidase n=1 Tax=unclassified Nonomuraea TaxID=2593643 RepID=UPI003698F928